MVDERLDLSGLAHVGPDERRFAARRLDPVDGGEAVANEAYATITENARRTVDAVAAARKR
ncbi:hypothetical protein [Halorubrum depositum]|uniref:hypothetical protein n=1 Tax=Halorubrum depositum TaxID=2583992 RepID=UPI001F4FC5CC|nr:hypothetical protein [Halorubrum depositum]